MDVITVPGAGNGPGHGGRRVGAGRKPGSGRPRAELTKARDELDAMISDLIGPEIPSIVAGMVQQAKGAYTEREIDGQKVVVYQLLPDFKFGSYLLDRAAGKPRQAVEIDPNQVDLRTAVGLTAAAGAAYEDRPDDGPDGDAPG